MDFRSRMAEVVVRRQMSQSSKCPLYEMYWRVKFKVSNELI
jgi:hypothetical protein